jgi:hypothetical protein
MPKPQLSDFPTSVLSEAARAVNMQAAVLRVLLASAQAEAGIAGAAGVLAVLALGSSFDEMAAEAIRRGHVTCRLTPLSIALGVFPIAQLALHLYIKYHSPSQRLGTDLSVLSEAISFAPSGVFNPQAALTAFRAAHYETVAAKCDFDVSTVYTNIVKALCKVQGKVLVVYGSDDRQTNTWADFVYTTRSAVERRRSLYGYRMIFENDELLNLLNDIRDFAGMWQRRKAQDIQFMAAPSHLPILAPAMNEEDLVRAVLSRLQSAGAVLPPPSPPDPDMIAAMVRGARIDGMPQLGTLGEASAGRRRLR